MNGHSFRYILREGITNIFLHSLASFTAVGIMIACLIIMGSFVLVAANVSRIMQIVEEENEVVAFVDETLTDRQVSLVGELILRLDNVSEIEFISKDEALKRIQAQMGDEERRKKSDVVIFNDGSVEETKRQIDCLLTERGFRR